MSFFLTGIDFKVFTVFFAVVFSLKRPRLFVRLVEFLKNKSGAEGNSNPRYGLRRIHNFPRIFNHLAICLLI
jgi:hypothetical protein